MDDRAEVERRKEEVDDLANRLAHGLQELLGQNQSAGREAYEAILGKLTSIPSAAQTIAARAPIVINKEGLVSYFEPTDISQREVQHRILHAKLVEDVVLGLIFANSEQGKYVTYPDISDELYRLDIHEDRNTTYGRISRLRKEGSIAAADPDNKVAYSLTEEGRKWARKMLKSRKLV